MGKTPDIEMCLSGRDITEPRPTPDGDAVIFLSRPSGEACSFVEVLVDGGSEKTLAIDTPPAAGRGGSGGVWCFAGDGDAIVYVAYDGTLRVWPDRTHPATTLLSAMDGPIESPVPVVGRNAVVVTADRGSVWMIAIGNGDVERLDDGRHDFCADPAVISDRGMQVVTWQGWSVPDMPWDHSVQVRCDLDERSITVIAGKGQQQQITGSRHGVLSLRDDSGWLNVWCDETLLIADAAEHGGPSWGTSQRSFAVSPDGEHLAFTRNLDGFGELCVYSFDAQKWEPIGRGVHHQVHWGHGGITALRSGARTPNQLVVYRLESGASPTESERWGRTVLAVGPSEKWASIELSEPSCEETISDGHRISFRRYGAGLGRCLVHIHGGPTDQWQVEFLPRVAYWQSQGWDVIIPDPRGSTGHGRSFTQALHGEWGRADVDDVAAVISECQRRGWSTPSTTVVMGSSSGGMAVLGVLIDYSKSVAGGIALYPVSDAASLAGATHRFEAHYNDTLIGPLGDPRYEERSMVGRADFIRQPLLLMHGTDDPVVPVAQSRALRDTLYASGVEVRYTEFEGEGHGLRNPQHRRREYELVGAFLHDVIDR